MPLHLLAPALGDRLVREIDPFLCRKMRHLPFPPAFRAICSPADGLASFLASHIRDCWYGKNIAGVRGSENQLTAAFSVIFPTRTKGAQKWGCGFCSLNLCIALRKDPAISSAS